MTIFAWVLFGYALLYGVRYLLGARVYLTCALREVEVKPISREQLDPAELRLLTSLDGELAAAGFRHLGFGQIAPFLTYYAQGLPVSVFVNEQLPAYALVRQHAAPEYGNLVEVEVWTTFGAPGYRLVTVNTLFSRPFTPRSLRVEGYQGMPVAALVERHAARVAAERDSRAPLEHSTLENVIALVATSIAELRTEFREHGWVVPTTDHTLDRFTLRGAFTLTHYSRRVFGARQKNSQKPPQIPSGEERLLRIEADLRAISRVADNPESAPGTPWPLLTVIGVSGLLSFVAMAWLWNPYVAGLILAAITLLIIGLVKRIHVRDELIDAETLRIRLDHFHPVGRMASPDWYCRTGDRFELKRPR